MHVLEQLTLDILSSLEAVYGLLETVDGKDVGDRDIKDIITMVNQGVSNAEVADLEEINLGAFTHISLLVHVSARARYYDRLLLDFSEYAITQELISSLDVYTRRVKLNSTTKAYANNIAKLLHMIDKKSLQLRFGNEYRYLRIFIIMILHGNFVEGGSVAEFLLAQIERSKKHAERARETDPQNRGRRESITEPDTHRVGGNI